MTKSGPQLEAHIFVCTHNRETGESCAARGSAKLRDELKTICAEKGLKGRVRVNSAGCLGQCTQGIAVVNYPKGEWYLQELATNAKDLYEKIFGDSGQTK
jgi:(2Fe-2S) ferredoxin